jgi:NAD(P)-dependent dehydrogenase (short-subunit alcohol dehydrogenase family)
LSRVAALSGKPILGKWARNAAVGIQHRIAFIFEHLEQEAIGVPIRSLDTITLHTMVYEKVALVTAGSAGLGACIAKMLARDGMRVVINYSNNTTRANALISELRSSISGDRTSANDHFIAIKADVGDRESIKRLVEETYKRMGRIDVVVSNAGWTKMRDFLNLEDGLYEEDWDRCFKVNVKSHLWLFHAVRPYLDETEGAFVTTASVAGIKPSGSSLVSFKGGSGDCVADDW